MHTILIVDDEADIREVTTMMLEKAGYTAYSAGSAGEAVRMVEAHRPDLVLLDVFMPEKNGLELAMELSQHREGLSIILMSGRVPVDTDSIKNFTGHFGVVCSLAKPFTPQQLQAAVKKVLERAC